MPAGWTQEAGSIGARSGARDSSGAGRESLHGKRGSGKGPLLPGVPLAPAGDAEAECVASGHGALRGPWTRSGDTRGCRDSGGESKSRGVRRVETEDAAPHPAVRRTPQVAVSAPDASGAEGE